MTRTTLDPALMARVWAHLRNRAQRPAPTLPEGRGQLRITDEGTGTADIYLYDEIGYWGVMATEFVDQLLGISAAKITLHVNSPGGDVFDGVAIYNALLDHPAAIDVKVDGLAASAASFISMAGDTITMNRASQMMIHDASGICIGNASDMREMTDLLDRVSDTIAGIYAARAGGTTDAWRAAMRTETWYSAVEAVEAGLADTAVADKATEEHPAARFALHMTSFHFAGRAAAPKPAMPGRVATAAELPLAPGVDGAPTNGDGAEPRTAPTAPAEPEPPAFAFDPDVFRSALHAALPKEAVK